ncbi:unnamed protein product [Adineta ricciae]|uniref:DUF3456 domain-containing protein n=1 Tax=Adineta ricciae TaxID=249248 RepID=A0A814PMA7_ADIRI|nr:unnamed protein product [Adineta ricciae]
MSDTIFHEMNNVDPNERVQVGSYRVDGHGHQKLKDVPITETRYHAENVLDNICTKFLDKGKDVFFHQQEINLEWNICLDVIPKQLRNIYEHACDDILEEHHESLIDLLVTQNKNIQTSRQLAELLCVETNEYCKVDQFDELFKPSPPTPPTEEQEEEEEEKTEL